MTCTETDVDFFVFSRTDAGKTSDNTKLGLVAARNGIALESVAKGIGGKVAPRSTSGGAITGKALGDCTDDGGTYEGGTYRDDSCAIGANDANGCESTGFVEICAGGDENGLDKLDCGSSTRGTGVIGAGGVTGFDLTFDVSSRTRCRSTNAFV